MNEQRFGKEIKGYLNQGLDLPPAQIERLRAARQAALARQRVTPAWLAALTPSSIGIGSVMTRGGPQGMLVRYGLPLVLAAALLFGWQYGSHQGRHASTDDMEAVAESMAELDSELLKGDLPIKAYLDGGFQAWMKGGE